MAIEIRLCVKYPIADGGDYVVCSNWMLDTPGSRGCLEEMMSHAHELSAVATWWIEKRDDREVGRTSTGSAQRCQPT